MTEKELFLKYNLNNASNNNDTWLILLHASYQCNANCIYCEHNKLRNNYKTSLIDKDLIKQIVYKLGPRIRNITWHGGEPLLIPETYFQLLVDERNKYNYDFSISLQTNGILLTKEKFNFLKNLGIEVGSSYDGLFNTYARGEKSTQAILNLINDPIIKEEIGFIGVVTNFSVNHLIENYEFCKQQGIKYIQSNLVRENVIEATNPYIIKNEIAISNMLNYIKYWIYDTNNPIKDTYLIRQIERLLGTSTWCEDGNCIGGWLIIDPEGNIATCGMSPIDDNFCNIKDIYSYKDLLENKKYINFLYKQKQLYLKSCSDCEYLSCCYGGCMGLNYEKDQNFNSINERNCSFTKGLLDGIYEIIKDLDLSDETQYNPYFLEILKDNNYISLTKIKQIEKELSHA